MSWLVVEAEDASGPLRMHDGARGGEWHQRSRELGHVLKALLAVLLEGAASSPCVANFSRTSGNAMTFASASESLAMVSGS